MTYFKKYFLLGVVFLNACGYSFQNSQSPLRDREGIRTVYIAPVVNNSYKAGVEKTIYNDLIRTLVSQRRVVLASNAETADAVLKSTVTQASLQIIATNQGNNLPGASQLTTKLQTDAPLSELSNFQVVTQYSASLGCFFELTRVHAPLGKAPLLWNSSFSRSKPISAADAVDVLGTTNSAINDSEFERALTEMSRQMMVDVHESMLAMF